MLETPVLILQGLEPLELANRQARVLGLPVVEGGIAHAMLTAQVGCPGPRLSLAQRGYDLFLCVPLPNHESSFNALF